VVCILVGLLYLTYSRSAAIGLVGGVGVVCILSLGSIWKKYKIQLAAVICILAVGVGIVAIKMQDLGKAIISRE
jgi:multidrug transporter EmrE-like cation transporter